MYTHDVIQIVDVYPRSHEGHKQMKIDPDAEAQSLSMLVKPLGRDVRKIAIVAKEDERRLLAYQRAGYETHPMNGNRPTELKQFIRHMTAQIRQAKPKHTVVVSDDPDFFYLCEAVASFTELSVWANSATVPQELKEPEYGFRPLEDLLPNLKIARIDVRLDLENIFIGLVKRGWRPDLRELVEAIRRATDEMGEVVAVTGYADFDELNRHHGGPRANWQRELTLAGGESRYVINQRGKNTADMKIADDIRTLVEHTPAAGGSIDIICLATMDRDFRHIVDTARSRGKKVVVLGLKGGLSRELEGVANQVRYLDDYLKLPQAGSPGDEGTARGGRDEVTLMLRIAEGMHRNNWRFVHREWLEKEFGDDNAGRLHKLLTDGWLSPRPGGPVDAQGQARTLEPNPNHTTACAAHYLARWIPARIEYCLGQRGMQYVDSHFIANGMTRDTTLTQLGVGQTRPAAENWLRAAASARLVVAEEITHPQNHSKSITTWRLPAAANAQASQPAEVLSAETQTAEAAPAEVVIPTNWAPPAESPASGGEASPPPASGQLRQLLTQGLSDGELTRLLFDHFRPVHRDVDGAPKFARVQALLDYVERCRQHELLLAAVREINPALFDEPQPLALAA